jgi:2-C-methyl-D-erythritol 2,4-cyclodiphosphate synthase
MIRPLLLLLAVVLALSCAPQPFTEAYVIVGSAPRPSSTASSSSSFSRRHASTAAAAVPLNKSRTISLLLLVQSQADDTNPPISTTMTTSATTTTPYEIEPIPFRIGHGFDIHRMAPLEQAGQPIVIAGVEITHAPLKWTDVSNKAPDGNPVVRECQLGVVAHSDGDVIYHAIVDAIFGALTLPDIGQVFQDTDPRWKGCDSSKFMEHAVAIMSEQYGYQIGNVDVTLILERPKVAAFKPQMKENIVRLLKTTPGRVNVKARTHEQVDSVGELRSLACHVVLTLERARQ